MSRKIMHVVCRDGRWNLEEEGSRHVIGGFSSKDDAVKDGKDRERTLEARGHEAQLIIDDPDDPTEAESGSAGDMPHCATVSRRWPRISDIRLELCAASQ